jgi:hypothetical protein
MEKLELERKIKLLKERGIKGITIAEILGTSQSKVSKCEIEIDNEKVKEVLELIESKGQLKLNVEETKNIDEEIEKIKKEIEENINKKYKIFEESTIKENEELKETIKAMEEKYKKSKKVEEENINLKNTIYTNRETVMRANQLLNQKGSIKGINETEIINENEQLKVDKKELQIKLMKEEQKAEIFKELYKEEIKINLSYGVINNG